MVDKTREVEGLIVRVVAYVKARSPESIDQILDNSTGVTNSSILDGILASLADDIDALAWLCGYFAGEINRVEDNQKLCKPIMLLSLVLLEHGFKPFEDFAPYSGCRLTIFNADKFELLPPNIQYMVEGGFDMAEMSSTDFDNINEALRSEMEVMKK
jgi:hypothetical protein